MSSYKTALIGCGRRGQFNARAIRENDRLELAALVDANLAAAETLRGEHGSAATAVFTDHREMLRAAVPDLCVICVWTGLHLEVFRDCAEAGVKAVFMEKPVAATWGECREIERIADATGCRLSISHQRRFHRGNEIAHRLFREGLFGEIIRMDLFSPKGLLDCGTHTIDQAFRFLDDRVGVKWVHGAVDMTAPDEAYGIPEAGMFSGTLAFENGILANIYCNTPEPDQGTGIKVFGTKGFMEIAWTGAVGKFAIYDQPGYTPPGIVEEKDDILRLTYQDVLRSMAGEENQLHYKHGIRAAEVIFALYESARAHRRVDLPLAGVEGHPLMEIVSHAAAARC